MLQTLRRLVSFGDWSRNHPSEPPPGGDLDATFDAIFNALGDLEQKLLDIRRDDGTLKAGAITRDALDPRIVAEIAAQAVAAVDLQLARIENARNEAVSAKILTNEALAEVEAAAGRALSAALAVESAKGPATEAMQRALAHAETVLNRAEAAVRSIPAPTDYSGEAQAWAQASMEWAEWMPDTLPRNSLVWQDISGDHWSARWWANRADNAFGRLTDLYLGAWREPPFTNLEGGPIQVGSIYYDLDDHQPYVWDGSSWHSFWAPSRAITAALWYRGTNGQADIVTSTPDMNGDAYTISSVNPEAVDVFLNGLKLVPDLGGPEGDYVYDPSLSKVTLKRVLRVGDIVNVDVLLNPATQSPVAANMRLLVDISPQFDGVLKTFALQQPGPVPILPDNPEQVFVSLDGVWQQAGWSYTISGSNITFAEAPLAGSKCFMVFMGKL